MTYAGLIFKVIMVKIGINSSGIFAGKLLFLKISILFFRHQKADSKMKQNSKIL
jgi:hypothetical protein